MIEWLGWWDRACGLLGKGQQWLQAENDIMHFCFDGSIRSCRRLWAMHYAVGMDYGRKW